MKVIVRAKIDRLFSPATDYLAGGADRSFVTGRNAGIRKTLISRLFTLCAQAHSAAAALLLFPEKKPDMQAAQQELARETLRRALTDWLPCLATDRQPLKNGRCYVAESYPRWQAQSF